MEKDWKRLLAAGVSAKPLPPPDGDFCANVQTAQKILSDEFAKHGGDVSFWSMHGKNGMDRNQCMLKFQRDGREEASLLILVVDGRVTIRAHSGTRTEDTFAGDASAYSWEMLRNLFAALYNHLKQGISIPKKLNPSEFTD